MLSSSVSIDSSICSGLSTISPSSRLLVVGFVIVGAGVPGLMLLILT